MGLVYLPDQVLENLLSEKSFQDIEQFAMSNGINIAKTSSRQELEMELLTMLQSGMMSKPLMENNGLEKWILSLEVSHVNHLVSLAKVREKQMSGICGQIPSESLAKYDLATHSWKTYQGCFPHNGSLSKVWKKYGKQVFLTRTIKSRSQEDTIVTTKNLWSQVTLDEFSGIFPKSGMIVNGMLYQQPMLEQSILGKDFGLSLNTEGKNKYWRTPNTMTGGNISQEAIEQMADGNFIRESGSQIRHPKLFPTPRAKEPASTTKGYGRGLAELIQGREQNFPTPTTCGNNNKKGASATSGDGLATSVKKRVDKYTTPRSSGFENYDTRAARKGHDTAMSYLESAVDYHEKFPTPMVQDSKGKGHSPSQQHKKELAIVVCKDGVEGQLDPVWVELLMGYPVNWTSLEPMDIDILNNWSFRSVYESWIDETWEDGYPRVSIGVKDRMKRLKTLGNGWVVLVLARIILVEEIDVNI